MLDEIDRYLQLRPIVRAELRSAVPEERRRRFAAVTQHQLDAIAMIPPEGLTMGQLANVVNVTAATATALADRLVAQHLVVRQTDAADRRIVRLVLTANGQGLAREYACAQRQRAELLFSRLSEQQILAFLDVIETLASARNTATPPQRNAPAASTIR